MTPYKKEPIKGFEEYSIDTDGAIYGKKGNKLKYSRNHKGYCIINLYSENKRYGFQVHRLVAQQFIENPENKPTVNHIDGNKTNNSVSNLEWCTYSEQMQHSYHVLDRHPSNEKKVVGYDKHTGELIYSFDSLMDAGRYFADIDKISYRRSEQSISRVITGLRKSYKNCIWKTVS